MRLITLEIPLDVAVKAVCAIDEVMQEESKNATFEATNGNEDKARHMRHNVANAAVLTDLIKAKYGG